jgi:hypothetical protein
MAKIQEVFQSQINVSELFHIYGELLSDRQRTFIQLYYDENLSLSEIAERHEISRQAVHDAIKHGRRALAKYEETLGILHRSRKDGSHSSLDGWHDKAATILDEMEKCVLEETSDREGRLLAQIASLRELMESEPASEGGESFSEEAAA